jgi:UV DNA damage repair endonuclease
MTTQTFQEIATGANGFESRCTMHPARNLVQNSSKKLLKQSKVYKFINSLAHRLGKLTLIFQATDCGLNTSQTLHAQRSKL